MMGSSMFGIIFFKRLSLDFSGVIDLGANTRNVGSSVHDYRDSQHAVPKKSGAVVQETRHTKS